MAIQIEHTSGYGVSAMHHVVVGVSIDRSTETMQTLVSGYAYSGSFSAGHAPLMEPRHTYDFSDLPTSLKLAMVDLKDEIEAFLIASGSGSPWEGGTLLNDNGTEL